MEIVEKHERYVVEKVFDHKDLKCVVTFCSNGWRCGYVGVPRSHRFYGKDYMEVETLIDYGNCHGGITYSSKDENSKYPIESDSWWFGFDCAHYGDGKDLDLAIRYFPNLTETLMKIKHCEDMFPTYDEVRTCEYVVDNCISLANQLAEHWN